jgi:hypothetical protein
MFADKYNLSSKELGQGASAVVKEATRKSDNLVVLHGKVCP